MITYNNQNPCTNSKQCRSKTGRWNHELWKWLSVAKDIKQNQWNSCEQLPFIKNNLLPYYGLKFVFFTGDYVSFQYCFGGSVRVLLGSTVNQTFGTFYNRSLFQLIFVERLQFLGDSPYMNCSVQSRDKVTSDKDVLSISFLSIHSDKGLMLEPSAFKSLYVG